MKNVLVTAIGTVTATSIIKELKSHGDFYIIGADINNQNEIASSLDVDEYYKFPCSTEDGYVEFALDFCEKHNVDYYYAVIDKEVVNISKRYDSFQQIGTKLCIPNYDLVMCCHYKNVFGDWLREHFPVIAITEYKTINDIEKASYPVFVKPCEGVASKGCRKIDSYDELIASFDCAEIGKTILVQEYVIGENITVDCLRNRRTGQKMQVQRKELLRNSNGCGIAVEIIHDEKLENICNLLLEELDLNGVVNIEFFKTEQGYKIIEVNPRFSAGTLYSCLAGVNTVLNAIKIAEGEPCTYGDVAVGSHYAERYEVYRMD